METLSILNALREVQTLLVILETMEEKDRQAAGDSFDGFSTMLVVSYHTVKLKLFLDRKLPKQEKHASAVYLQVTFEIENDRLVYAGLYCEKREQEARVEDFIKQNTPPGGYTWNTSAKQSTYSESVTRYLTIADTIAKQAHHCNAGDDYRPGYFSEIVVEEDRVVLKQINHWNSRSIDHRNDYTLRDLEFDIPITGVAKAPSFQDETIGDMLVYFFDRSSENNKGCGNKIKEQIEAAKREFTK
ncbi:hypothetical protein [Chryseolinea lacunae]|uniref:Uncharacterized protein n=1 Tax=Chryseolinea lacunae TaxID=2801331 RepID=A0ABS1KLU5_9BACT|nr:hypothetical protein [Chryseolinea lacunae]MBL0740448.1 hypothetical protein [Chryseolinea lacunae]